MNDAQQVLLDTCAIIYVANGDPIDRKAKAAIRQAASGKGVLISPVSAWEIGLLSRPGRQRQAVQFLPDPKTWFDRLVARAGIRLAPCTPADLIASSVLPGSVHGDPADRMLIAQARSRNVPIITRDRLILDYAGSGQVQAMAC